MPILSSFNDKSFDALFIFSKKREQLEPTIFLKKNIGNFNAYSKSCPANVSKQPVILTDEEKEYIDNKG